MKTVAGLGIQIPRLLLPCQGTDLSRWAVIACDQFTSQPEYWEQVSQFVGAAPSTYNLILPEVYLEAPGKAERIARIQGAMERYLDEGAFETWEGLVYVERRVNHKIRRGLMLCLDLERYDYHKGSQSLIRATEGTIIERLPPRMQIREGAPLELPHILVLIDDPDRLVIEPLAQAKARLNPLYDFDLMFDSGHLSGYLVAEAELESQVIQALERLASPMDFARKYGVSTDQQVLLFAMGDGNHSLATAKAVWEKMKSQVGPDHPARYALVEIENVHDEGLDFEPIHRVLFNLKRDICSALAESYPGDFSYSPCASLRQMVDQVNQNHGGSQRVGMVRQGEFGVIEIAHPPSNLPVGTLQAFLDDLMQSGGAEKIDYVHGEEVVSKLGAMPGNAGFYLPAMDKSDLFKTVILDGALPRKTFSMGEAREKRFYMECRKIVP